MDPKVKEILDQLNQAFTTFREANDERLKRIEAGKPVDVLITNKLEAANTAITNMQTALQEHTLALKQIENAMARELPIGSPEQRALEDKHALTFLSHARGVAMAGLTDDDRVAYRAYKAAFSMYLRRGDSIQDPNVRAALQTGQAPAGGFLVTPDLSGRMVEFLYQTSMIRQYASVTSIGTDTLEGTADLTEADSGWVSETGTRAETTTPDVPFPWKIPVHEQYANPRATQKMLDDTSFDVEGWLAKKVAAKLSRRENTAFVTGLGVSSPRGFTTYSAGTPGATASTWQRIQQINSGASGAFTATNPVDKFLDVVHAVKAELRAGCIWAMNNLTLAEVRKFKDGEGRYLLNSDISAAGVTNRLLGYPVAEFSDMADMASASLSIAFANFAEAYQIVDHNVGIRTLRDPFTAKPYIQFYTTKRVGGGVISFEAIKLMKFSA